MAGTNVLGDARPGGVVLWTHPTRTTKRGAPMPVLAVGDEGDGRSIALGIDSLWTLKFSDLGARTAGRGHGALWDGLLGWLMRDPRFEPAQMEILEGCTAGLPSVLRAQILPAATGAADERISIDVSQIDRSSGAPRSTSKRSAAPLPTRRSTSLSLRSRPAVTPRACASETARAREEISPARRAETSGPTRGRTPIGFARSPRRRAERSPSPATRAGSPSPKQRS